MTDADTEALRLYRDMSEETLGRFGEAIWSKVFLDADFQFIPLCRIETGRAPSIEGHTRIVLPDFEVLCKTHSVLFDSKAKRQSVLFRKTNQIRHGIDGRLWQEYQRASRAAHKRAGLGIVELWAEDGETWSGSLLVECLSTLGQPILGFNSQTHMVYWPRKLFVDLDSHSPSQLRRLANGHLTTNYRHELEDIFGKPPPAEQLSMFD